MPNHVTNLITLSGDAQQIEDLKKLVNPENEEDCFDFNGIIRN